MAMTDTMQLLPTTRRHALCDLPSSAHLPHSAGACPAGQVRGDCWEAPAAYKRVYLVDMEAADDQGFVRKVAYVDLMDIKVGWPCVCVRVSVKGAQDGRDPGALSCNPCIGNEEGPRS